MSASITNGEDKEIISKVKQGDRCAFDLLVDKYKEKCFFVAYRMVGNTEDAKDVLQEAFVKVFIGIHTFNERSKFYTWVYRIVVNCSFDLLRKRKRSREFIERQVLETEHSTSHDAYNNGIRESNTILMNKELRDIAFEHVNQLSDKQRICFILKYQDGLSNADIADVISCSVSTVKVHLFRAVHAIRKKMKPYMQRRSTL